MKKVIKGFRCVECGHDHNICDNCACDTFIPLYECKSCKKLFSGKELKEGYCNDCWIIKNERVERGGINEYL